MADVSPPTRLSELLALPVPSLPSLSSTSATSIVTAGQSSFANGGEQEFGAGSVWADEEERKFYEELRELRGEVPASFLGIKEGEKEVPAGEEKADEDIVDEEKGQEEKEEDQEEEMPLSASDGPIPSASAEPSTTTADGPALPSGPASLLSALLLRLSEASSLASIDASAFEFCFLNSKAARRRLVKFLASVSRNRQDVLPYYARLVGTLQEFMPDIGRELVGMVSL